MDIGYGSNYIARIYVYTRYMQADKDTPVPIIHFKYTISISYNCIYKFKPAVLCIVAHHMYIYINISLKCILLLLYVICTHINIQRTNPFRVCDAVLLYKAGLFIRIVGIVGWGGA